MGNAKQLRHGCPLSRFVFMFTDIPDEQAAYLLP